MKRYWVRWRTVFDSTSKHIQHEGWDVCDGNKFDRITVRSFGIGEHEQAEGLCKLLNSIHEEEMYGLSE